MPLMNPEPDPNMPLTPSKLFERLKAMGIETTTLEHAPVMTVEDSHAIHAALPGAHTKNLFLKSDKGTLVLVVAHCDTKVDLKALGKQLAAGRFSFGKPELLMSTLGVTPGAVTAFAIANDGTHAVKLIFDQAIMAFERVNCHPLENTATANIARDDLLRFIRSTGHEPEILALTTG